MFSKKEIHILGDLFFESEEQLEQYISTFSCEKKEIPFLKFMDTCTTLHFNRNDQLSKISEHYEDGKDVEKIDGADFPFKFRAIPGHPFYFLVKSDIDSGNYIGRQIDEAAESGESKKMIISCHLSTVDFPDFPLETFNIKLPEDGIEEPRYIDLTEQEDTCILPELPDKFYFKKFSIRDLKDKALAAFDHWNSGSSGIPSFVQEVFLPVCPKSGKLMKFLCQFNLNQLNIGEGVLYVFFESTSQMLCVFSQET